MKQRLTQTEIGILATAMSDASCAALLGRSQSWVRRNRAAIAGAAKADEADTIEVLPAATLPMTALEQRRPNAVRYIRWFHAAGWSLKEIGRLFDVSTEDLAEVLL